MKTRTIIYFGAAVSILLLISAGPVQAEWQEFDKVTAGDGAADDFFGTSVCVSGDYAIVGAYHGTCGSAYIFKRNGTACTEHGKLVASDGAYFDYFGWSVSISGDYAIVGAYSDDSFRGSAYVFGRSGMNWVQQAKLTASDGAANDAFGWSVGISGDYAIVGAYGDDDKGSNSGSAYLFANCPSEDLTGDCFVDFDDFALLAGKWLNGYK